MSKFASAAAAFYTTAAGEAIAIPRKHRSLVVTFALLLHSALIPALAGPDRCVVAPSLTLATCTGNQSDGVRENPPPGIADFPTGTAHLIVRDLTTNIVTPYTGIKYQFNGVSTVARSGWLEYYAGNTTLTAGAGGIVMGRSGARGPNGSNGGVFSSGGNGGVGETWLSATLRSVAQIKSVLTGINVSVTGGAGGAGGDNGGLCAGCGGATGGDGGAGSKIIADGSGAIATSGNGAQGILLLAAGGNGSSGRGGSLGGSGGNGGAGGGGTLGVSLQNIDDWSITTANANAPGVQVRVAGGNGGDGGSAAGLGVSGGRGGAGGHGSATNTNGTLGNVVIGARDLGTWTASTRGDNSDGFYVSTSGGIGGESASQTGGRGLDGGAGGDAAIVFAWNSSPGKLIATTLGNNSPGLHLESAGGNGGIGGSATTGGAGGAGGNGTVLVLGTSGFSANLTTSGTRSPGVLLHSTGGNGARGAVGSNTGGPGGAGGSGARLVLTGNYDVETAGVESDGIAALSFGGDSGRSGTGVFGYPGGADQARPSGSVMLNVMGSITTAGPNSSGIDAQSVAGHGGNTTANWGGQASAGSAGVGGDVTVTNGAKITTAGDQSTGITAGSYGGGGGIGGSGFGLFAAVGGNGGIGGDGGAVKVANSGDLATSGNDAAGIFAQSVGGTGGSGGIANALPGAAFGGSSQFGGNGGAVVVTNSASIGTGVSRARANAGALPAKDPICGAAGCSAGIFAQSVGGGGGNAGSAAALFSVGGEGGGGGNGSTVTVTNFADRNSDSITTGLANSDAISAQSVGGGGGTGGGAVGVGPLGIAVALGGSGGAGGDGGSVFVTNRTKLLSTAADHSRGITAESIGGGGGESGFAIAVAVGIDVSSVSIAVGGSSKAAGKGGSVSAFNDSDIRTAGKDSAGIYAQSSGGGGGTGGYAISASGSNVGAVAISVGGSGGAAGDGGNVAVEGADKTRIETQGDHSTAIYAQSTGGGGGNGGFSVAAAAAEVGATFAVGRSGGVGGSGGSVTVRQGTGSIKTAGNDSKGINAQSVANSGGDGGLAISIAAGRKVGPLAFAMGGDGAAGGTGGDVRVINQADITTAGDASTGVFAQSIGGGGGNGGMSVAGGVLTTKTGKAGIQVAIGGGGGNGGRGGAVTVINDGNIVAKGDASMGIAAQSVGKGGGTGGLSVAGQLGGLGGDTVSFNLALGGNGGGGGDAGAVSVTNTGDIETGGATVGAPRTNPRDPPCANPPCVKQYGISAQSVGGGGGRGGIAGTLTLGAFTGAQTGTSLNLNTAVGGSGGAAGRGGEVRVTNSGAITTVAAESSAIFAQSVSGGGGDGGQAINYAVKPGQPAEVRNFNSSITVGGSGGSSQVGGRVTVANTGALKTSQYASHGIFAQSVGGGGGTGGDTGSFQLSVSCFRPLITCDGAANSENSWRLTAKIGGAGGTGNDGGVVTVTNAADITTTGGGSDGINATSIGGGGGNGGSDSGLTAPPSSLPYLTGDRQTRFKDWSIAVGGNGGAQGNGANVTVTQDGHDIHTEGLGSSGIWAQSVGGGGGSSKINGNGGTVTASGQKPAISVGGQGGAGGDGGAVTVNLLNGARITTSAVAVFDSNGKPIANNGAYGIFAQSVGGGGGVGGSSRLQGIPLGSEIPGCDACGKVSIGIGLPITGKGGLGGNGGAVTVNANGSIETGSAKTPGDSSPAILAQSVGGGGGMAGFSAINVPFGIPGVIDVIRGAWMGSTNSGGSGGKVTVNYTGDIKTWGNASHGIMAQSAGSGKADTIITPPPSNGGGVTIDFNGRLEAKGKDAVGIWAQSVGSDSNGDIKITIGSGSLVSGGTRGDTFSGAGIELRDGASNIVTNAGTITSLDQIAIVHIGQGTVTINNTGEIIGQVLLKYPGSLLSGSTGESAGQLKLSSNADGSLFNVLNNAAGGTVRSDLIDLGDNGRLFNSGLIVSGGDGAVGTTRIIGSLYENASSVLSLDLTTNSPGALLGGTNADMLSVSGDVVLSGNVFVNTLDLGRRHGEQIVTFAQAGGTITASDLNIKSMSGSDIVSYRVLQTHASKLDLAYLVDFAAPGVLARVNANQDSLAQYVQRIYVADGLDNDIANKLIDLDGASYARGLNSMSAEIVVDNQIASVRSSQRFGVDLGHRQCASQQQACTWSRAQGKQFQSDATADNLGFETEGFYVASGAQSMTTDGWRMGTAFAYEGISVDSNANAASDGDQFHLGFSFGREVGKAELSSSLAAGYVQYDVKRAPQLGGASRTNSEQSLTTVEGRLGAGYRLGGNSMYVKPRVDLSAIRLMMPGFSEKGDSPFLLDVASSDQTYFALRPAFEIGAEFAPRMDVRVRPHATLIATHYFGDDPAAEAMFVGKPGGATRFETGTNLDDIQYSLAAGLEVLSAAGMSIQLEAFMDAAASSRGYGASLELRVPF